MFDILGSLMGIGKKVIGNITGDMDKSQERQAKIDEAEISGAPTSGLRLWRSALGWALSVAFVWEVMIRPILTTYWPDITLPPSFIKEVTSLLLGMLGLGI